MREQQPGWRTAATNILYAALILKTEVEDELQNRTGLLLADNEALLNLVVADEPLRMSDLAQRLVLSPGGTTKVIDRLEARGYVERQPLPGDRRATVIEVTDAGEEAMTEAQAVIDERLEEIWAEHVTEEEAAIIITAIGRFLEHHHNQT